MSIMKKILSYPLSIIYYLCFGLTLVIFHVIQWVCLNVWGYSAHKKSVDLMCFFLVFNTYILGTRYRVEWERPLPNYIPIIFVSNHQSFYDIPALAWFLRKVHPKFVSKYELGSGIPGISYNLRKGGSVLIKRDEPRQALREIAKLGEYIEHKNRAAIIFPEGKRSKTGKPNPFNKSGLKILCKESPSAYIVPISINNAWKMTRNGKFPMTVGNTITLRIHKSIPVQTMDFNDLFNKVESIVVNGILDN